MAEKLWPGITATGDIAVTATLAIFTFLVILISGFAYQGAMFIRNIVPGGIPLLLWPIMWPIEFIGLFTKPFALAIRLLANMTAGHMIILVLLGFYIPVSILLYCAGEHRRCDGHISARALCGISAGVHFHFLNGIIHFTSTTQALKEQRR
jgi:F0F1-type ATP synthase membrane subunit a